MVTVVQPEALATPVIALAVVASTPEPYVFDIVPSTFITVVIPPDGVDGVPLRYILIRSTVPPNADDRLLVCPRNVAKLLLLLL